MPYLRLYDMLLKARRQTVAEARRGDLVLGILEQVSGIVPLHSLVVVSHRPVFDALNTYVAHGNAWPKARTQIALVPDCIAWPCE